MYSEMNKGKGKVVPVLLTEHHAMKTWLDDRGFEPRQGLGIFLFTNMYRLALGPTQLPIQWEPGALSLGLKRPGCEADHTPSSSTEVECLKLYLHSSIRLHGVVLSLKITGTTLPLPYHLHLAPRLITRNL
jgi:hypothetical protein